jgi:quinoprotein glucose dehydrogenase
VPGERTALTQPFPTKPAPFDRQGTSLDDLIDFTPALKEEAIKIASQYQMGPLFTPPMVADTNGKLGTLMLPHHVGGGNWPGGAADPEAGILYVASVTNQDSLAVSLADSKRSDMGYVGGGGRGGRGGQADGPLRSDDGESPAARGIGPQGLPLIKPPWGRITAIDLNTGDHLWMAANGEAPDYVKNHPAMKGIDLSNTGRPSRALLMVTKTLLFAPEGNNLFAASPGGGGNMFRVLDKRTGKLIHQIALPAMATGIPMTYMVNDRQFIVVAVGAPGLPAELIALALP